MIDFLFICSQNKLRSPTCEHVARTLGYKAISAGIDLDAIRHVTQDDVDRADRIICMQGNHLNFMSRRFPGAISRMTRWSIDDIYDYCDPELIGIVKKLLLKPSP